MEKKGFCRGLKPYRKNRRNRAFIRGGFNSLIKPRIWIKKIESERKTARKLRLE